MATGEEGETSDSDVLYHYARTDGMVGILTSKQVWASGISFLNDGDEIVHALKLAAGLTEGQIAEVGDSTARSHSWLP